MRHIRRMFSTQFVAATSAGALALTTGCYSSHRTPSQSGATVSNHEGAPTVDAPTSRRKAQQKLYEYMSNTLQYLPEGIALDNTRYEGAGGGVDTCDDRIDSENAPIFYYDSRDMHVPKGIEYNDLISKVGEIWRGWGWSVEERDGTYKPNRQGKSPEGYTLNIQAGYPVGYPPTMDGNTPCFSPQFRHEPVPIPRVITHEGLRYDEPSASPTR